MEIMKIPANTPINANSTQPNEAAPASDINFLSVLMSLTGTSQDIASEDPGMDMPDGFPDDEENPLPLQDASILASFMAAEALAGVQFTPSQDSMQPNVSDTAESPVTQAIRQGAENIRYTVDVSGFQPLRGFADLTKNRSLQATHVDADAPVPAEAPDVRANDPDTALSAMLNAQPLKQTADHAKANGISPVDLSIITPDSRRTVGQKALLQHSGTVPDEQMLIRTSDRSVYSTTNTVRLTALNIETDASGSLYTMRRSGTAFGVDGQVNSFGEIPEISVEVTSYKEVEALDAARTLFESSAVQAQRISKSGVKPKILTEDPDRSDVHDAAALRPELLRSGVLTESQQAEKLEEPMLYQAEADTVSQVRTGIEQKLGSDESEFVIKLKPEGLGEITVEMARRDGRIILNLIASSSETEKLLSDRIEALRESLRVYNADIAKVGFSQSETQPYAFLADHSAFSYSEENQRQWQFSEERRRIDARRSAEAVSRVSEPGTEPVTGYERSLLNRYV